MSQGFFSPAVVTKPSRPLGIWYEIATIPQRFLDGETRTARGRARDRRQGKQRQTQGQLLLALLGEESSTPITFVPGECSCALVGPFIRSSKPEEAVPDLCLRVAALPDIPYNEEALKPVASLKDPG